MKELTENGILENVMKQLEELNSNGKLTLEDLDNILYDGVEDFKKLLTKEASKTLSNKEEDITSTVKSLHLSSITNAVFT